MNGRSIEIVFVEERIEREFEKLKNGKSEEKQLYKFISRAMNDLKQNPMCGIKIPRDRWPKAYIPPQCLEINIYHHGRPNQNLKYNPGMVLSQRL